MEGRVSERGNRVSAVAARLCTGYDFTLIDEAENELRFALESTPDTLRAYPFPFLLEIGYRLEGNKVEVLWRVKNTGDQTMHFQIGAHPAFLYPNYEVDQPDRGYFAFDVKKDLVYRALVEKDA